ncbi:MAG: hypothetical protein NTV43_03150 [Methylococcales bacterium]|nr:hypothetical protein [Methylococcales bacterium]
MKKNNLTRGAFALLLLASTAAGADQQYPAADFQPEVLYQDSDYIAKNGSATKVVPPSHKPSSSVSESQEVDSKYPAANFQPEVLYQDTNYKPSVSVKASVKEVEADSDKSEVVNAASPAKDDSSFSNYLLGLLALAGAGFYLFKTSGKCTSKTKEQKKPTVSANKTYALNTGVAKYLNKVSGTGVSRYLEAHVKSATVKTGVAKYMAKQAAAPKATENKAATGVEKYMRDRG